MPKYWISDAFEAMSKARCLCVAGRRAFCLGWVGLLFCLASEFAWAAGATDAVNSDPTPPYLSPCALAASADGKSIYVACAAGKRILVVDAATGHITQAITLPHEPSGLAWSTEGPRLYITCSDSNGTVYAMDLPAGRIAQSVAAGAGACAPVLDAGQHRLYVCSRFLNQVAVIDCASGQVAARITVVREPIAAALAPDGQTLVVANHLPLGPANADWVSGTVSLIDTRRNEVVASILLPNGSTDLQGVAVSPDGKLACVSHTLARYNVPTTQIERGWMSTSALSLIDLSTRKWLNTVLLDDVDRGAANPWDVAWTPDAKRICVTHAGTHELSIIDAPALLAKLAQSTGRDVPDDLSFMTGLRQRVPVGGNGPRALAIVGRSAWTAEHFSDTLSVVDLATAAVEKWVPLGPKPQMSVQRRGEALFNDASICFQGWQSCATCHPEGRTHGLNWDLLNDGLGNPKNAKSMLLAHLTPPAMSLGIRETAETAVRSGIRNVLFAVRPEEDAVAMDEYLKSMKALPSPFLVNGKLSDAAQRGKSLFHDAAVGCAECHVPELYTNLRTYDVGTRGAWDTQEDRFDTPTLIECWRTGPYLHDGSAVTVREVVTTRNSRDRHGRTSQLSTQQIDDLVAYVLSL
jgi:DNA-binding beta-propeller fold protein YncE